MPRTTPPKQYQPPKRSCQGKVCYLRREEAELAAGEIMIMQPGLRLGVYKCPGCGGWHLTSREN